MLRLKLSHVRKCGPERPHNNNTTPTPYMYVMYIINSSGDNWPNVLSWDSSVLSNVQYTETLVPVSDTV